MRQRYGALELQEQHPGMWKDRLAVTGGVVSSRCHLTVCARAAQGPILSGVSGVGDEKPPSDYSRLGGIIIAEHLKAKWAKKIRCPLAQNLPARTRSALSRRGDSQARHPH